YTPSPTYHSLIFLSANPTRSRSHSSPSSYSATSIIAANNSQLFIGGDCFLVARNASASCTPTLFANASRRTFGARCKPNPRNAASTIVCRSSPNRSHPGDFGSTPCAIAACAQLTYLPRTSPSTSPTEPCSSHGAIPASVLPTASRCVTLRRSSSCP